jgi:hypothetical protein
MTRFLRRKAFQNQLIQYFNRVPPQEGLDILVTAGSIGCEAVTLAALAYDARLPERHGRVTVHSVDLSEKFTAIAQEGVYPVHDHFLNLPTTIRAHFKVAADGQSAQVLPHLKQMVNILPARKITDLRSEKPYDATLGLGVFYWIQDSSDAFESVRQLSSLSRGLVCVNGLERHNSTERECLQPLMGTMLEALDAQWKPMPGKQSRSANINRNDVSVFRRLTPAAL